jgi:hypothetical protein
MKPKKVNNVRTKNEKNPSRSSSTAYSPVIHRLIPMHVQERDAFLRWWRANGVRSFRHGKAVNTCSLNICDLSDYGKKCLSEWIAGWEAQAKVALKPAVRQETLRSCQSLA